MNAVIENVVAGNDSASLTQAALDYQRIEKAIRFLQNHFLEQPELAAIAHAAHLSEFHFQRLFTRWAGISPKRFLQFLTIEHAKHGLSSSRTVLDVALDSGLSSPGRLHDLFVSVEAVTPGEFKSRGSGIEIQYGFHPTPFGWCLLGLSSRGICWLSFAGPSDKRALAREMKGHWRGAAAFERPDLTGAIAAQIFFAIKPKMPSLNLLVMGTNFQLKVWEALLRIPTGAIVCYGSIAHSLGCPTASRAVGAAVGRNAISYLIPCHRVFQKSGLLGGYRWGPARKQAMVAWEAARMASENRLAA